MSSTPTYRVLRNMIVQLPARAGFVPIVCSLQMPTWSSIEIDDNDTFSRIGSTFPSAMVAVDALSAVTRYAPGMQMPIGQADELVRLAFPLREGEAVPGRLEWRGHLSSVTGPKAATGTFAVSGFKITVANRPCWIPGLPPAAQPTNLTAASSAQDGDFRITLTWLASIGATAYQVFRGATSGGEVPVPIATVTTTNYLDTGLPLGTTYFYYVVAINDGSASAPSNEATASTIPGPPPGMTLWLNAQDGLQITGSDVTGWTDKSGNGYTVTATQIPGLSVVTVGGSKYVAGFDGSGKRLTVSPLIGADLTVGFTYFAVVVPKSLPAPGSTAVAFGVGGGTSGGGTGADNSAVGLTAAGKVTFIAGSTTVGFGAVNSAGSVTIDAPAVWSARFDPAGNAMTLKQSGEAPQTANGVGSSHYGIALEMDVGGFQTTNAYFFTGYIAEILVYQGPLSDADILTVRAYLNARYSVAP